MGQAIAGDFDGTQLELIAALQTDWASWKERHPNTVVINPSLFGRDGYEGYYLRPDAGVLGRTTRPDVDLNPKEFVIGVRLGGEVKAYPFRVLNQQPIVNDVVGDVPLVVFFDKGSAVGAAFSSELADGTMLTFEPVDDLVRHALHRFGNVVEEPHFLVIIEQIEQGTGLAVVVVALSMVVAVGIAGNLQWRLH